MRFSLSRWIRVRYHRWQSDREWARTGVDDPNQERPLLLRERYFAFRKRLWEFRQSIPMWPRTLQALFTAGVVAVIVVAFLGVKAIVLSQRSSDSAAKGPNLSQAYADAADDADTGAKRVLVAGDASAFVLAYAAGGSYDGEGIHGVGYGTFGCGIAVGTPRIQGKDVPLPKKCANWAQQYRTVTQAYKPDLAVLMLATSEAISRTVDGQLLEYGTPELERYLIGQIDKAREALTSTGARMVVMNDLCTKSDLAGPRAIVAWLNSVWAHYHTAHPDVAIADYDSFACPDGASAVTQSGRRFLDDKGILTEAGAPQVWGWLAREFVGTGRTTTTGG